MDYEFKAEVWLYGGGKGSWYFVSLPQDVSAEIRENFGRGRSGWGSIRVIAEISGTDWQTSIFPDSKTDIYLLPIKSEIRQKTGITAGSRVSLLLKINV